MQFYVVFRFGFFGNGLLKILLNLLSMIKFEFSEVYCYDFLANQTEAKEYILLIDDARFFNGTGDYPTIENLTSYIKGKDNRYNVEVKDDIIRYTIN